MFSLKLLKNGCVRSFRRCLDSDIVRCSSTETKCRSSAELFFMDSVQDILKKLVRVDIERVYEPRKDGVRHDPPKYKFMTTSQYNQALKEAEERAQLKVQMPPVLDERTEIEEVLVKDANLEGYTNYKFVFADITYGIDDRKRNIIVRDADGTLREAKWDERDRINQIYFPRPGRKIVPPRMFQPENLKSLLERGEYLFILDFACCQFEPDDPVYINVCNETYTAVDNDSAYNKLRSTRHFGPLVFYLVRNKKIDNLLTENLATDRLEDAVWLIQLYHIVNPEAESAKTPLTEDKPLEFIQEYIAKDCQDKNKLELTFQMYKEYLESSKQESN